MKTSVEMGYGTREFLRWWISECRARAVARIPEHLLDLKVLTFCPLGHRFVFRRCPPEDRTPGGLHIPIEARKQLTIGWVVSIGPEASIAEPGRYASVCPYRNPLDLVGEMVLINFYGGSPLHLSSTARDSYESDYVLVSIGDCFGPIFEKE